MFKRSSLPVVLTVVGALAAVFFGYRAYSWLQLRDYKPTPLTPGKISLVAFTPGKGYKIVVANRIAQIVEVEASGEDGGFGGNDSTSATNAKRLPIRELLGGMSASAKDLGLLIEKMNGLNKGDEPYSPIVWKAEDIQRALGGDLPTLKRLEEDLHTTIDGEPVPTFSISRITNGITVDIPITAELTINGQPKTITARVRQNYKTRFAEAVETEIFKKFNPTREQMLGVYSELATKAMTEANRKNAPSGLEDVKAALDAMINPRRATELSEKPVRIIGLAQTLVTEAHLEKATLETYKDQGKEEFSDIIIRLTEEGRKRLWKYSFEHKGFQLLLIVDGVAISAPRIKTELAEKEIRITRIPDLTLAQDAVTDMNRLAGAKP